MATSTLLQIVQDMLSAIEAEGVTTVVSGSTTEEALMCVNIANRAFESVITDVKWKHLRTYKALTAGTYLNELKAGTSDLYIAANYIWYGAANEENKVFYIEPEDFIQRTIGRDTTDATVTLIAGNNIKVYNDRDPVWFTTFDDETLIFDSMPTAAGLVNTDSKALVYVEPTTRLSANASVYDLPKQVYPHFRDLCIAIARKELAGEATTGERDMKTALRKIHKVARAGNMIMKDDNAFRDITTRQRNTRRQRVIVIS